MIATRFRTVGWTGCVFAAALSFYLVSQTVATKRAELASVDRKIAATQREIRQLETEIGTRGGMAQIENWNSRVYGLQAPGAAQFVSSTRQLVAMADPQPLPLDPAISPPHGPVQQASLTVAPPAPVIGKALAPAIDPMPAVEQPMVRQATYIRPSQQAMTQDVVNVRKASLTDVALDEPKPVLAKTPAARLPAAKPVIAKTAEAKPGAKPKLAEAKPIEKKPAKAPTKMTALDDAWLADVTGETAGKRSRKGRP
ncbi:MAG: hypothetical protein JWR77_1811 [Rhizorhabdus sp.]|nr:hypothetical protein [Rhizorhabdus sp.]